MTILFPSTAWRSGLSLTWTADSLLCCDGFRHVLSANEFCQHMGPRVLRDEKSMSQTLLQLTEEIKRRREADNISAILIRTCR